MRRRERGERGTDNSDGAMVATEEPGLMYWQISNQKASEQVNVTRTNAQAVNIPWPLTRQF